MATNIKPYDVSSLHLDPENPRLPETIQGHDESELLDWFFRNGTLEELARSFVDNGFFAHEPLIVLPRKGDRTFVVLEGNRRLATLKILLGLHGVPGLTFDLPVTPQQRDRISRVPCYVIESRDDVHSFLGFRHIGGIKAWEPEAKARYLLAEVQRAAASRADDDPFRFVGRRVGSNAAGVRTSYQALRVLQFAKEQHGVDVSYVQRERFGVWLRCMNSEEIRDYIGLNSPKTYEEVERQVADVRRDAIAEVLQDLTPQEGYSRALLADSRSVTYYGRILANQKARKVLRKYARLEPALEVIRDLELPARVREIAERVRVLIDDLTLSDVSADLVEAVAELFAQARSARDIVKARGSEE